MRFKLYCCSSSHTAVSLEGWRFGVSLPHLKLDILGDLEDIAQYTIDLKA